MKWIAIKGLLVSVALGAAVLALGGTADASHVAAEIAVPDGAAVGEPARVEATLRTGDEGLPIADVPVTFYMEASFGDVDGRVELGRAVTDENGVATLTYEPRLAGEREIQIEYFAPGDDEPGIATRTISVAGGTQLYRSTAGVDIPGLNVWLLIALVSGVWAVLLSVAFRVIVIAHDGGEVEVETSPLSEPSGAGGR